MAAFDKVGRSRYLWPLLQAGYRIVLCARVDLERQGWTCAE